MPEPIDPPPDSQPAAMAPSAWKLWGTLGWSLVLLAVMSAMGLAVVLILAGLYGIDLQGGSKAIAERFNPIWLASLESMSVLAPICLVIAFAARRKGWSFSDYLALRPPSRRHALIGMIAIIALLVVTDSIARIMHLPLTSTVLIDGLRRDPTTATLVLMAVSLVVTTPLGEELVFRGFIYRGLAASRLGVGLAVILSSVMFTALHVQYDTIGLAEVLASGLLLGTMRAISGSTVLTIAMHALVNSVAFVEAVLTSGIINWPN
jgi:hypothetical protein